MGEMIEAAGVWAGYSDFPSPNEHSGLEGNSTLTVASREYPG